MPTFSTKYILTNGAILAGTALADIEYIAGAFKTYPNRQHLNDSASAYPARFTEGQIVYVSASNELFKMGKYFDDQVTFTDIVTSQSFSFPGGGSTDISALNTFTGSAQTSLTALNAATSSYALKTDVSGAFTSVSSSVSTRLTSLEAGGGSVPSGTISSSTQISDFGFISSSQAIATDISGAFTSLSSSITTRLTVVEGASGGDVTALNLFTGSIQSEVNNLTSATSSYGLKTDISGAFTSVSGGLAGRITTLEGTSGGDVTESIVTSVVTNNGSSYYIIDNIEKPKLSFAPGLTYRFNLSGIVGSHPFKFSTSLNGPTQYTTGVTSGSGFIQIEVGYNTTTPLYYYCTNHNGMGNEINVLQIENLITNSQTSSMSVLSALTASFISDIFISASAVRSGFGTALFPSGLLSSSFQIATDISGAFTSLSSSFASRITALEVGSGGGSGIFALTGSFYSTTNNLQITGSLSVGSGSFKSFEVDSDGFVVLGDMDKDLNNAPVGTIAYSGSSFYLIS